MHFFSSTKLHYLIIILLAASLIGAKGSELMTLTIRNKSGQQVALRLITSDNSLFYYLIVPANEPHTILDKTFTIPKAVYKMRLYYYLEADPATGHQCPSRDPVTLMAVRNIRITVTPCFPPPVNRGEPTQVKYSRWRCIR
ncbi:MAG: hypothetical protein B6D39_12785 [Anaerolineae bacterium UTCFX2]|jgi:hypothetical protein|nr:hypothetical protein [Anaerolineae bacterium]MCZ7551894.1 hypothetical protein [Anaerolineales bacterium]OQY87496.1 MAG: hypothetical protein B6D39_12785 [Anaerolineae bacterium UTCFX2]